MTPTIQVSLSHHWQLSNALGVSADARLFRALAAIRATGSVYRAAREMQVSYRHLWGLLRDWGRLFGTPVVTLEQGRGATLTPLGERLLWSEQRVISRIGPELHNLAAELARDIQATLATGQPTLRIHASHDIALTRLREVLSDAHGPALDLQFRGSLDSLEALARGACDCAGFHVAEQPAAAELVTPFRALLKPRTHRLIALMTRSQGLMLAAGNPLGIRTLGDLARATVRFVNRQRGSGTRLLFDHLLAQVAVGAQAVAGYEHEEFTHVAVAATVASGAADAGFGIRAAAAQFGLEFVPLASERYFLACAKSLLDETRGAALLAVLSGAAFRAAVAAMPGYDATDCGRVLTVGEALT